MSVWEIFCYVLLLCYGLLLVIYYAGWLFIPLRKTNGRFEPKYGFSVLIPARNEAQSIRACIQSVVRQNYPASLFEIIVINDHSTDETAELVQAEMVKYPTYNIRLLEASEMGVSGKKACIGEAINRSNYEYICLTDADCTRNQNWLRAIDNAIQMKEAKLIYAPVYFSASNMFEKAQTLEFMGLMGIGAAAIQIKNPNMCSAANLIVKKSAFFEVEGYKGNENLASGDDEFLLHKIFKVYPEEVYFLKDRDAIVETSPNASVEELAQQRRRWVSKSTKYENRYITAILIAAYFFNFSILFNAVAGFIDSSYWTIFLIQISVKMLTEFLLIHSVLRFFERSKLILLLPLVEPFHIFYVLIIGIWANINTYTWKERNVS